MAKRKGEFKRGHRSSIASAFAKLNYTVPNLLNENESGSGESSTLELTGDGLDDDGLDDDGLDEKPEPPASNNLYIKHLPMGVTEDMLQDTFQTAGHIQQLRILRLDNLVESAALIRFSSPEEATAARTTLDGTVVNGSTRPLIAKSMAGPEGGSQEDHVYIENVPTSTLEEELEELFSKYGKVEWSSVLGYTPGKSRVESTCAAFVEMSTFQEASAAVAALNGTVVHFSELIRPMKVRYAENKAPPKEVN
jgi:RNA recognition motif-containing protein